MGDTVAQWERLVAGRYPPATAAAWDSVGLQVGDPAWEVERVLVCLDVTSAVVAEAADGPPTLVLAHHPLLFRPLARLTPTTASGRVALAAAGARVAVLAAHTNLDVATDGAGTSDPVVGVLGLADVAPLTSDLAEGDRLKLVTFVPVEHTGAVLDALAAAGAGTIGNYERCSFRLTGTGTFRPVAGADPFSGEVGRDHEEREDRLELEVPRGDVPAVLAALRAAHPYDEVAYDLYPQVAARPGFGRVGDLEPPLTLREVATRLREHLPAPHLRYAGDPERRIRRLAVVGGAGDSLIGAAHAAGADCYVTGDLRHHATLDALEQDLALIDAGHHATESAALPRWIERLRAAGAEQGLGAQVLPSEISTVPWVAE